MRHTGLSTGLGAHFYETGQLDATDFNDYLDDENILTLGMSWRGGHLDAKMSY